MLTVDTHIHSVAADRARYPLAPVGGRLGEWVEAKPTTTEELLAAMAAAGVDRALLIQGATAYGYDNAYTIDSVRAHPDQLVGIGMVDMLAPGAPDHLSQLVAQGLRGVRLFTTPDPEAGWLDDPRTFDVWERTRELGIPMLIQVWSRHLPRLRPVLQRFPEIPVALDHLANAQLLENTDQVAADFLALAELPNVYAKLSTVNLYAVEKQGATAQRYFQPLLDRFGAERLMWGSNYPNTYDRSYGAMLTLAREAFAYLSEDEQAWIFGGTAARLWPELLR